MKNKTATTILLIITLILIITTLFSCKKDENTIVKNNNNNKAITLSKYYHWKTKYIYSNGISKDYYFSKTFCNFFYFDDNLVPKKFDIIFDNSVPYNSIYNISYSDTIFFPPIHCVTKIYTNPTINDLTIWAQNPGNKKYKEIKKIIFLRKI